MDAPISSSYRKYKQDTNIFTTWLAKAAARWGWRRDHLQEEVTPAEPHAAQSKAPKLKGRAQKLVYKAGVSEKAPPIAQISDTQAKASVSTKYSVDSKTLLEQARFVANCTKPKITIPNTVLWAVNQAISARKRFSTWYRESGRESDAGHVHFIRVLEEALALLQQTNDNGEKSREKSPSDHDASTTQLNNRFEALEIDEVELDGQFMAEEAKTTRDSAPPPNHDENEVYELELPNQLDFAFDIFCFFEDLHQIQDRVRQAWTNYAQRRLDLLTATLITNAAVHFAQRTEDELIALRPSDWSKPDSYEKLTGVIFFAEVLAQTLQSLAQSDGLLPEPFQKDPLKLTKYDEFLYLSTFRTLRRYTQIRSIYVKNKIEMPYPPPLIPLKMELLNAPELLKSTDGKRWEQDDTFLSQYLMDLGFQRRTKEIYRDATSQRQQGGQLADTLGQWRLQEDGISRLLLKVIGECELSVTAVFAARLLLDIQDVFENKPSPGLDDLYGRVTDGQTTLNFKLMPNGNLDAGTERWRTEDLDAPLSAYVLTERAAPGKLIMPNLKQRYIQSGLMKDEPRFQSVDKLDPEQKREALAHLKQKYPDMLDEPPPEFKEALEEMNKNGGMHIKVHSDGNLLFNRNPAFCGTIATDLAMNLERAGIDLVNHHQTVFALAHLYNAAKQLSGLKESWPSLEKIMQLHIVQIFGGELPKKPIDCANRIKLKLGYPLQKFARNPRQLGNTARTMSRQKVTARFPHLGVTEASTSILQINDPSSAAPGLALAKIETLALQRRCGKRIQASSRNTALAPGPALDLLETYMRSILDDITVGYISMTRFSSHLLRRIRRRIKRELGYEYTGPPNPEASNDVFLLLMTLLILEECAIMDGPGSQLRIAEGVIRDHIVGHVSANKDRASSIKDVKPDVDSGKSKVLFALYLAPPD